MSIEKLIEKWERERMLLCSYTPRTVSGISTKDNQLVLTGAFLADLRALKAEQGETSDKGRQDALKEAERQEGKQ